MRSRPRISLIAAMSKNRVIGVDNKLPWHIPSDLKRFRQITSGSPVIMGRKTYESIGRLLPNRQNIIITRQSRIEIPEATVVNSLEAAFEAAQPGPNHEVFVIGGAEVYRLALGQADRLYITLIDQEVQGDAYFPEWSDAEFSTRSREDHADESTRYSFLVLDRRS